MNLSNMQEVILLYPTFNTDLFRECLGKNIFLRGYYQKVPTAVLSKPCHLGFVSVLCSGNAHIRLTLNNDDNVENVCDVIDTPNFLKAKHFDKTNVYIY